MPQFTYRTARSGSLVAGITVAVLAETIAVHALLYHRSRIATWILVGLSFLAIAWVMRDYSALGTGSVTADDREIVLTIGRRYAITVPRSAVEAIARPTFRDIPAPGTPESKDYLDLLKPGTPNVLIILREPMNVRVAAGIYRRVKRLGLHLDDPAAFVAFLVPAKTGEP